MDDKIFEIKAPQERYDSLNNLDDFWKKTEKRKIIQDLRNQSWQNMMGNDKQREYRFREWADNSNTSFKPYIYNDFKNKNRNNALNFWYNNHKDMTGNYDLTWEDFLNTPQTLYRADNAGEDDDDKTPFFSYATSKKMAERFLSPAQNLYNNRTGRIKEIQIAPKDTLGLFPSEESEILIPNKKYEEKSNKISNKLNELLELAEAYQIKVPYSKDYLFDLFMENPDRLNDLKKYILERQ